MAREFKILVVEDEPLISMMLEDFIDFIGHRCAAATGLLDEAVTLADAGDFDLAIVDLNLAGGKSAEPVLDVLEKAGKPFLVATGDTGYMGRDVPLLRKPYNIGDLERAIEALLPAIATPHAA